MSLPADSPTTQTYISIGVVVYYYCGDYIASPALGSAGPVMKKICYGLALPALFVSSIIFTHLSAKYLFIRLLKNSAHLTSNSLTHWVVWLSCVGVSALSSFVIAEGVPVFDGLISLVGALFGTIMSKLRLFLLLGKTADLLFPATALQMMGTLRRCEDSILSLTAE